jgi:Uma2 family endonuclease
MKAVMPVLPEFVSRWRKTTGADRYDEMWDGVLHMGPTPNRIHQELEWALETWLRIHWVPISGGKVYHQINVASVGGWPKNYRIPDLVLLRPQDFSIDRNEYFEGAPGAVVEIRSPQDETYEKLAFYADIGVREVWIIDRDTKQPELHRLVANKFCLQPPDADCWLTSDLGVQFRRADSGHGADSEKLCIRVSASESSRRTLPED